MSGLTEKRRGEIGFLLDLAQTRRTKEASFLYASNEVVGVALEIIKAKNSLNQAETEAKRISEHLGELLKPLLDSDVPDANELLSYIHQLAGIESTPDKEFFRDRSSPPDEDTVPLLWCCYGDINKILWKICPLNGKYLHPMQRRMSGYSGNIFQLWEVERKNR